MLTRLKRWLLTLGEHRVTIFHCSLTDPLWRSPIKSTKFLGVHLAENFTWSLNTTSINKKAQQRLYFLWRLRKARLPPPILTMFYRGTIESVGCELEEKERFWSELDEVIESISMGERVVIGADFNGHFGEGNTGSAVLGVSPGRRKEDKETWWWNEEVQDSIQRKRLAKKKRDMDRTEEKRQEYKESQRRVKKEVSKVKQKAYDELYTRLDTREGEKDLYRLARQRDRDGKDVQQVRVIKDRDGRVLTSEESVQRRWKEYFEELMNEENEREKRVEGVNSVEQKVHKIRKDEVRKALKRMKNGKAIGPDDIPVEVWKCLGEAAVEFLISLFNRVLENLEKAYDRVPREELWYCMRKSGVAEKYVRVVQDMYERSRTVVRCAVGQTEEFKVEVGLHQGSALSPFLFAIVMDQLSEEVRKESPWTIMFADDIVICSESREQVEENLERWRFALERRGMKVSRSKTEYMCVNEREGSGIVRLQGEEVKKIQEFKYLGSTVQSNGECGKEVKKRVQAGVGLGPLVPVKGTLNVSAYQDILVNVMPPTLREQFGDDPFLLQYQCTSKIHKDMDERVWCGGISQSPDLNPIEHLWDELERRLRARPSRPTSVPDLTNTLLEERSEIPINTLLNLNGKPSQKS
ncbi:hypothetical protein QTP86_003686 [Hemibagrus guttatus]|nr:hypothetical protein QTP86_003686 [Hemibagrus guttatus]